jgi:ABC-2 type transport system ATP-binding protein
VSDTPVEARGLVKQYGRITAVDHVDLTVNRGDVYGFLGPNGAGKTTTLRMMLGLINPTAGSVRLFGRDPITEGATALDGVAGFVEAPRFYPYMSARTNMRMMAAYDGDDAAARVEEALETVELTGRADDKVGGYSHGMRQRLGIAAALLRRPNLLLLDEPATGLDPGGMRDMRTLIRRLADGGMTVLLSSHLLAEVEELCDRVAIVRAGRIVYEGAIDELKASAASAYRLRTSDNAIALGVCQAQAGVASARIEGTDIRMEAGEPTIAELSVALIEAKLQITALVPESATLEDLFFRLTEGSTPGEVEVPDRAAGVVGGAA